MHIISFKKLREFWQQHPDLDRLTEEVNRLVTKGIRENYLSPEEEKVLVLLTHLIEEYERRHESLNGAAPGD
jgi:mRNA-degrading endonuclease HigB of HigAB toxin-antitoxin module